MLSSGPRVRSLSFHADYRCGNSGVCCSSGWEIPVEPEAEGRIAAGLRSGRLRLENLAAAAGTQPGWSRPAPGLPHGARIVLRMDAAGGCIFLDPCASRRCAVHRQVGDDALPSACRQFPRVVTLTPLSVSVALSHYCPTAASLLFAPASPLRIVENPRAFPSSWPFEGLDARSALPPLLRPGVLMSWPALERWEDRAVATLADEALAPEQALARLAADAEAARGWTPAAGDFDAFFAHLPAASAAGRAGTEASPGLDGASSSAWDLAAAAVPDTRLLPALPEAALAPATRALVDAGWPALDAPIRRWLASKAFASWLLLQGQGLRTAVRGLELALAVLRAEAARGCARREAPLDAAGLKQAIRRADLLLAQLVDPQALADRLSACEQAQRLRGGATRRDVLASSPFRA